MVREKKQMYLSLWSTTRPDVQLIVTSFNGVINAKNTVTLRNWWFSFQIHSTTFTIADFVLNLDQSDRKISNNTK